VGKSFVAAMVAQYKASKGQKPLCIDTDPVNSTFHGYKALGVRRLELIDGDGISSRNFDTLIELVATSRNHPATRRETAGVPSLSSVDHRMNPLAARGASSATDANGKLWTMQYIKEDGTKRFAKNSRKEGCFHVVGGIKALVKSPILLIAEGYATAATLSQTLGFATVAAFDSGNLVSVAKALHEKYPEKQIIIAGDDDKHLELTHGTNPGRSKAEEAARAVGGKVLLPIFAPNENSYPASLEAVTPQKFRKGQLSDKQHQALAKMKRYTDFNDLATKSVLGSEGVERQVRSVLDSLQHARVAHAIARSERSVPRRKRL